MRGSSFALQKDGGLLLVKSCYFVKNYDIYICKWDCLRHTGPLSCLQYSHRVVILWLTHQPGRPIVSHVRRVFFSALTNFAYVHLF